MSRVPYRPRLRSAALPVAGAALCLWTAAVPTPACPQDLPDSLKAFTFRGEVRDFVTETPIREAVVQIADLGRSAVTDRNGYFEFPDLIPGSYMVVTSAFGYETNRERSRIPHMSIMVVRLQPMAIEIPGIEVRVERLVHQLEVRRLRVPVATTAFDSDALEKTETASIASFIRARTPFDIIEDATLLQLVYRFRGEIKRLRVCLDEVTVSSRMLDTLAPEDLARVELYESLGMVRMYTRDFLSRAADKGFSPIPITLQGTGC